MMKPNDRVGLWALISPVEGGDRWKCRCDCGVVRSVLTYNLQQKKTKSCGCARAAVKNRDMAAALQGSTWAAHNAKRKAARNVLI